MTQGNDKRQMFQVNGIIQHPQYNSVTDQNDIAILRLQTAVTFNSRFIQMACLPTFGKKLYNDRTSIFNSNLCIIQNKNKKKHVKFL